MKKILSVLSVLLVLTIFLHIFSFSALAVDTDSVYTNSTFGYFRGSLYFYDYGTEPSGLAYEKVDAYDEWSYLALTLTVWYPSGAVAQSCPRSGVFGSQSYQIAYWGLDSYDDYQGDYTAQSVNEFIYGNDSWGFVLIDYWDYDTMHS